MQARTPADMRHAMLALCDAAHAGDPDAIRFVASWLLDPDSPLYLPSAAAAWLHYMQGDRQQILSCPLVNEDGLMNYMSKIPEMIDYYAHKEQVDPKLIKAVIEAESAFKPNARSPRGAGGLMQIMPDTAHDLGLINRFDIQSNIGAGTHYLATLLHRYNGVVKLALAAYNGGAGPVDKCQCIPPVKETQDYVERVMGLFHTQGSKKGHAIHLPEPSSP
ncbi:MAG: lytic transglycosylase domain-containing protein [Acetobacter sp.]